MLKKILVAPIIQIAILTLLILVGMVSSICPWAALENANYNFWSAHFRAPDHQPIAIVAIDEKSIIQLGDWPWPRARIASMVQLLSAHGAAAQGICLLYAHPDQNPGLVEIKLLREKVAKQKWPGGKRAAQQIDRMLEAAQRELNQDRELINTIRKAKNVVLPIRLTSQGATPPTDAVQGMLVINSFGADSLPIEGDAEAWSLNRLLAGPQKGPQSARGIIQTFDELAKKSGALGHVNIYEDADGSVRHAPLLIDFGERIFPSFALQLAIKHIDGKLWNLKVSQDFFGFPILNIKHLHLSTDISHQVMVNLNREWTDQRTYSFADVLDGTIDAELFKDKIVLIGLTDPDATQTYRIRTNEKASAVEIHANLLAGLLSNVHLSRPSWAHWLELMALLYFAFFLIFFIPRVNAPVGGAILALFMATWYAMGAILLMGYGYWIKMYAPILLACIGFLAIQWTIVSRNRQQEKLEAYRALGLSYQGQGMLDMAYDKYMQCPVEDETVKNLLYNLALDFERKRMFNRALAIYEHICANGTFKDIEKRRERLKPLDSTIALSVNGPRSETPLMMDDTGIKPTFGRYEITQELGRGSMGTVYLGRDPKINREVAIKTLEYSEVSPRELEEVKARFFREAEAAGKLAHPNIVSIFDVGEEHDMAYIAMELLSGDDLTHHCQMDNLLPFDSTLDIIADVSAALDYAHAQGVVHRDIKPANIMVLDDGRVKVTDFGIAQVMDASQTSTGVILGTPNYMSPEQVSGTQVDGRSDLFSLGVVFYELLSGTKPFRGDSINAIMYAINHNDHIPLAESAPDGPECCSAIINRLLAKQADDRFSNAGELLLAIKACRTSLDEAAPRIDAPSETIIE